MFFKNPNESKYPQGKKNLINIIKNTGAAEAIIFRQPEEDFNTGSKLIVLPGEEALFIHKGIIQQGFMPGTYQLTTENYPFISRLRNVISGGISVFNCVVVFIRTNSTREILWGDRFAMRDPVWKIQTDLGTGGAYRIRVGNAGLLLTKILGSSQSDLQANELDNYFSSFMKMKIKSLVISMIRDLDVEILGIEANLDQFSLCVKPFLMHEMADHGLDLQSFTIDRMHIMDNDVRTKLENDFGKAAGIQALGANWVRDKLANVLQALADNPGSGGIANTAAGLGMGLSAMPAFSSIVQQISTSPNNMMDVLAGNPPPEQNHTEPNNSFYRQRKAEPVSTIDIQPQSFHSASQNSKDKQTGKCASCGAENPESANFCNVCGSKLNVKINCGKCGEPMSPDNAYCSRCGNKM